MMQSTEVKRHFDHIAKLYDKYKEKNKYYYDHLKKFLDEFVPQGKSVIDVGCGTGELLAHLKPSRGLGVDLSERMIEIAQGKFPQYEFKNQAVESLDHNEKFPYVLLIDIFDHVPDIWSVLAGIENVVEEGSTVCISTINPGWQPIFTVAESLKLKMPEGPHNFVSIDDVVNILEIFDYEVTFKQMRFFVPKQIPFISDFLNAVMPRIPLLNRLCAVQVLVAKKKKASVRTEYKTSVVIPCHNEEGNVERCAREVETFGLGTEIIFVDDGSTDGTKGRVKEVQQKYPDKDIKLISYSPNKGKGNAVREGFLAAQGEIIMILDADLTTKAEALPQFYEVIARGKAKFVNGSRMVYPMQNQSMRTLNLWGNQLFGLMLSWILGQRVTDTLCGTKALFKKDYEKMHVGLDKWGDYDLLFGASDLNLKLREIPVHYQARVAGESKMRTFQHATLLFRICLWGIWNLKIKRLFKRTSKV